MEPGWDGMGEFLKELCRVEAAELSVSALWSRLQHEGAHVPSWRQKMM